MKREGEAGSQDLGRKEWREPSRGQRRTPDGEERVLSAHVLKDESSQPETIDVRS